MTILITVYNLILDFFLPRYCLNCFRIGEYICSSCILEETEFFENECHVCRKETKKSYYVHSFCEEKSSIDGVFIIFRYNEIIKKLMSEYKYNGYFAIAQSLIDTIVSYSQFPSVDYITAVPLHKSKERSRGFNQSKLLAEGISKIINIPYLETVKRIKNTKSQMKLHKKDRLTNLENAFEWNAPIKLQDRDILIIDDVMTTGSTLEECAKILKVNGVKRVYSLVISRR